MPSANTDGPRQAGPELEARRQKYLEWIVTEFGHLEPDLRPLDGRLWSLNHARLVTGTALDRANQYFAGAVLTRDPDFAGIRLLKTLLDFEDSPHLSDRARDHLRDIIAAWAMTEYSRVARWPRIHTENHDLMCLTVGLFSEMLRGQRIEDHLDELRKSLGWRFKWGFYEWNSPRYQFHYSNALQVLAAHAPAEDLRRGAQALLDLMLAERALLSVGGYLGGCFQRGYGREHGCDYLDDHRYDAFLPTIWLAFGVGEPRFDYSCSEGLEPAGDGFGNGQDPRLNQDEGMFFATSNLVPHPVIEALLAEAARRPELVYTGKRASAGYPTVLAPPSDWRTNQAIRYYNTPHVSMGSRQHVHGTYPVTARSPSRLWSILFPARPDQVLRTAGAGETAAMVAQHRNWLLAGGDLSASHGLTARRLAPWDVYRVGKGLAAHVEVDGWHVFQVSDLDTHGDEEAFARALSLPVREGKVLRGATTDGQEVAVDLRTMAVTVDGEERDPLPDMLHDSEPMRSVYGTGVVEIVSERGALTVEGGAILKAPVGGDLAVTWGTPEPNLALPKGPIWGNLTVEGADTTVNHTRALGGIAPSGEGLWLTSVWLFIPVRPHGQMRVAVYVGGSLEDGPHAGRPARLVWDFGKVGQTQCGWVALEHPADGVPLPSGEVVWIAWKGQGGAVALRCQDEPGADCDFQRERGRWDSTAVAPDEQDPWPEVWPTEEGGSFGQWWYSCVLSYRR